MNRRGFFGRLAKVAAGAAVASKVELPKSVPTGSEGDYFYPSGNMTGTLGGLQRAPYAFWKSQPQTTVHTTILTHQSIKDAYQRLLLQDNPRVPFTID